MTRRPLPTPAETARILAERRTKPARRPPPPAGRSLAKFIKTMDAKFGEGTGGLAARWREIVGETLAKRTEPVKLVKPRGGGGSVLELRVEGPAAALIQHQAPEILDRVNLLLGAGTVAKLRIVQGLVRQGAAAAAMSGPKRRPGPLDAAAEAGLAKDLAEVPDGPLKQSLLKLGRAVLRGR
ncbi:MAG: DciA family protein [Caulobacteraceae bacterium]